jgi:hypothetical protein
MSELATVAPEVEWTVTITGQPLGEMKPETRDALLQLMEAARAQAEAMLVAAEAAPVTASLAASIAVAVRCWDARAKALKHSAQLNVDSQAALEAQRVFQAADEAFEDAFNILVTRFEKEFPNGSAN